MMKWHVKSRALVLAGFLLAALAGCSKSDDNGLVFGNNEIYMPQALQSGGISLVYAVPSGLDTATRNYIIDSAGGRINIILGVSRSGMQSADGYSVDIVADPDTVNAAIAAGRLQAVLLPEKDYSMPGSLSVPAGRNAATFYLSLDKGLLKSFAGEKVALAVKLAAPSRYELNKDFSETIVVIDVDALNL